MYIPESIRDREDYQACIRFHGHTCMGVTIGYLAAQLGLELLKASPAIDEEIIAIVETDACCCDAIQVLTGCTFGKGNFFFKDFGKMAFTFGNRETGEAYRLLLKTEPFNIPLQEQLLADIIRNGQGTAEDLKQYEILYEGRAESQFALGPQSFFDVEKIDIEFPVKAKMAPSEPCEICKEMVMQTKLNEVAHSKICRNCQD